MFVLLLPLPLLATRQPDRVLMVMMIYAFSAVHVHEYPSKIVKLSFVYTKKVEIRNVLIETVFFWLCVVCWRVCVLVGCVLEFGELVFVFATL